MVENLRKDKPESVGQVLINSGYSPAVAEHPSTVTESKGYLDALLPLLNKHDITIDNVLAPIGKALKAQTRRQIGEIVTENEGEKHVEYVYDYDDNIPLQLQGSDRAIKLMGLDKSKLDNEPGTTTPKDIIEALNNSDMDEVELTRAVFKKTSTETPSS